MENHPPRPRLALAVGIIGHRPNRLPSEPEKLAKIANEIKAVLAAIGRDAAAAHNKYSDYFTPDRPVVAVVSGLAEGADRLGAQAAITLKQTANAAGSAFELDIAVPFPVDVYKQDFKAEQSKSEFDTLLKHGRYALILPGERGRLGDSGQQAANRENRSYEDAGLTLLNQSDIILAVWDGKPGAGRGGTRELLDVAARAGTPIIHVDAQGDGPTRILWDGLNEFPAPSNEVDDLPAQSLGATLGDVIDELLRPPEEKKAAEPNGKDTGEAAKPTAKQKPKLDPERQRLQRYYNKRLWPRNFGLAFPALMAFFLVRKPRPTDWQPPPPEELSAALVQFDQSQPPNAKLQQQSALATAFGWADAWGVWLAQVFRSAFVMNFSFAAFAVVTVAISLVWTDITTFFQQVDGTNLDMTGAARELAHHKVPFVLFELVFIFLVLAITIFGYYSGWHHRWLETREVAERLRIAFPLWALGLRPTTFPAEEPAWTGWYTRAIIRQQGMRAAMLDGAGLQQTRATLRGVLVDQCKYHHTTAERMQEIDKRLELTGFILFVLTVGVLIAFLVTFLIIHIDLSTQKSFAVSAIAAGLPALGTAIFGIRVIGDFDGIARRSERTHHVLQGIINAIDAEDPPSLAALRARARAASDIMLGDVSSWRLAAESRTLAIPG